MTVLRDATIPAEFLRIDSTLTDEDEAVSVYLAQKRLENFNILVARRVRQPLLTKHFKADDYTVDGPSLLWTGVVPPNAGPAGVVTKCAMLGPWPIAITPYCQYVTSWIWAKSSSATLDTFLYYAIRGPDDAYMTRDDDKVTVTGTSYAEYETDIPVPQSARASGRGELCVFYTCEMSAADKDAGSINVVDWGPNYVVGDSQYAGSIVKGDIIYFDTDSTIDPRFILSEQAVTSGASTFYKVTIDGVWNHPPDLDDDYNVRAIGRFIPQTMCLAPKAISNFAGSNVIR